MVLQPGQAIRIYTGSPIPDGADAVVMQEDVTVEGQNLTLSAAVTEGNCIRLQGEEVQNGDLLLQPGALITPASIGVLTEIGLTQAIFYKRPRVAIIGTGSELVQAGMKLAPGQIYESNSVAIREAAKLAGADVVSSCVVGDEATAVKSAIESAFKNADVIITCGGISVGDHDLVREAFGSLGVKEVFWRVAMRPGKPFYFGLSADGKPVFGLPGNPVSALVTFFVFVRPALRQMMGLPNEEPWLKAILAAPFKKHKGRDEFVRAKSLVAAELTLEPTEGQGSHMLTGLANADYLIHLPESKECFQRGDVVYAKKLSWGLV